MTPIERTFMSLNGLSIGDALGAAFGEGVSSRRSSEQVADRVLPDGPWQWTDDTHMILSVVEVLAAYDEIRQNELAKLYAEHFADEPYRGYAPGTAWILEEISAGGKWRALARQVFEGGSNENGAAMRAAPIGGYFAGHLVKAVAQAVSPPPSRMLIPTDKPVPSQSLLPL
jgi:ADP-ribosylglycohydrolase